MKKFLAVLIIASILLGASACTKKPASEITTTAPYYNNPLPSESYSEQSTGENQEQTTANEVKTEVETQPQAQVTVTQNNESQSTEKEKPVTYYSDNPNNYYICRVAEKFGSDKANLVAFIKTNTSNPSAAVLEFSGARDENGKLIMTSDELKYMYDVPENGTIKRASADGRHNVGYDRLTAKVAIALANEYIIPSIPDLSVNRRYEDFF